MAQRKFKTAGYDALEEMLEDYWRITSLEPGNPMMDELADVERRAYLKSMQLQLNDLRASVYAEVEEVEEIDLALMRDIIRVGGRDWQKSFTDDSIKRKVLKTETAAALVELTTDEGTEAILEEQRKASVLEGTEPPLPEDRDWLETEKSARAAEVQEVDDLLEQIPVP